MPGCPWAFLCPHEAFCPPAEPHQPLDVQHGLAMESHERGHKAEFSVKAAGLAGSCEGAFP